MLLIVNTRTENMYWENTVNIFKCLNIINCLIKTALIHSKTKNAYKIGCKLLYENKVIADLSNTKYVGLCLHNTLDWRGHIDYIIPKLSSAWYAIRTLNTNDVPRNVNNDTCCLMSLINGIWHNILG